jgi:hypothetical protein
MLADQLFPNVPKLGSSGNTAQEESQVIQLVVGAPRFELGTSCAQGRRATRLRYAPTVCAY